MHKGAIFSFRKIKYVNLLSHVTLSLLSLYPELHWQISADDESSAQVWLQLFDGEHSVLAASKYRLKLCEMFCMMRKESLKKCSDLQYLKQDQYAQAWRYTDIWALEPLPSPT